MFGDLASDLQKADLTVTASLLMGVVQKDDGLGYPIADFRDYLQIFIITKMVKEVLFVYSLLFISKFTLIYWSKERKEPLYRRLKRRTANEPQDLAVP